MNYFLIVFLVIIVIQAGFFVIASTWKTDKVTDLAYGATFALIAAGLLFVYSSSSVHVLTALVVIIRGVRLAGYLFLRILAIGKDARFDGIRENVKSFAKFRTLQAVMIFLLLLPVLILFTKSGIEITRLVWLGLAIAVVGIVIEAIADQQKFIFKRQNPTRWVDTGLWSRAQHPNYFGELLVRWGVFLACAPFLSGVEFISLISPLGISRLLLYVTGIPPLQKQREKKYGDQKEFQNWKKKTNLLVPL